MTDSSGPAGFETAASSAIQASSRNAYVALAAVCALTLVLLVFSVESQIYDTNFYSLWEATALLAGDHPYRDFFEYGIPLQAGVSALAQRILGARLLSEFLLHWSGIVAGVGLSFVLARRLSGSPAALATTFVALLILPVTPTYHYPKLLFYPLAVWTGWRYFDRPTLGRAAVAGVVAALAFLFRHDHGVYAGLAALLAFGAARLAGRGPSGWRPAGGHALACAGAVVLCLLPWAALVQTGEGLPEYLTRRFARYSSVTSVSDQSFGKSSPFRRLLSTGPLGEFGRAAIGASTTEASRLPDSSSGLLALEQVTLAIPILLCALVGWDAVRCRAEGRHLPPASWLTLSSAVFLLLVDNQLLREPSYARLVFPLTVALGSQLLVRGWMARLVFLSLLVIASMTALTALRDTPLSRPVEVVTERLPRGFGKLLASPTLDGIISRAVAEQELVEQGGDAWNFGTMTEGHHPLLRYIHDCTTVDDRVWLAGSTPFHIGYLIERRIAGGHLFWHEGWRADPAGEAQSLRLLQSTSVPFFFSTNDPVLDDLKMYPRIREHVLSHYVEVSGTDGHLFVERDRRPTGTFGPARFPCFGEREARAGMHDEGSAGDRMPT